MNSKRLFLILIISLLVANTAQAGFGISSPYVINDRLVRGCHYEKKITLVRGDPDEDWKAEITINVPGANDWISVDKGMEFILAAGEKQTPIIVSVDVPKEAEFGNYKGTIRVRVMPLERPPEVVAIALGGQIDVDLSVVDLEIFDFKVRGIRVPDLEEGHKVLFWYVSGKIKFAIEIENTGNVEASPTKIHFDIYDSQEKELLESIETSKIKKVEPFETKEIIAKLPTKLKAGSYLAYFKIYKNDEVVSEGKIYLSILPYGTLSKGYQIFGLPLWIWIVSGIVVLAVFAGGIYYFKVYKKNKKLPFLSGKLGKKILKTKTRKTKKEGKK